MCRRRWPGSFGIQALQGLRGGEYRDALIRVQDEQALVARDVELDASGERASDDVIIIGVATDRCWQRLGFYDLGQALVVLHQLSGGKACGLHPLHELSRAMTSASSARRVALVQSMSARLRADRVIDEAARAIASPIRQCWCQRRSAWRERRSARAASISA